MTVQTDLNKQQNNGYRPKQRIEKVKYTKTFNSFEEGINDIMDSSQDIYELFQDTDYSWSQIDTLDGAMKAALQVFTNHMPSMSEKKNMHYDINLSANKCSIKTDKFISFGWYIKTTRIETTTPVIEYIFHITVFGDNKHDVVAEVLAHNWHIDEFGK